MSRSPKRSTVSVAELDDLVEVLTGVDVHDRERHRSGPEGLGRQVQHDDRVLAPREEQSRAFDRRGDLAEDVHRLGLELVEVGQFVRGGHASVRPVDAEPEK